MSLALTMMTLTWLVPAMPASAQTITWVEPGSGNWNTANNWNPVNVPDAAGETAVIPDDGITRQVTLDLSPTLDAVAIDNATATLLMSGHSLTLLTPAGPTSHGSIDVNGGITTLDGNLSIGATGDVGIREATYLVLAGPTVTNDGTITINSTMGNVNAILRIDSDVLLDGVGEAVLQTNGSPLDAQLNTLTEPRP